MPDSAPRMCRCGALVPDHGRCPRCPSPMTIAERRRGSSTSRGYDARWRKLRLVILARDDYQCLPCRTRGVTTAASEVDHIVPKPEGTDDPSNLQSICGTCHKQKTMRESVSVHRAPTTSRQERTA